MCERDQKYKNVPRRFCLRCHQPRLRNMSSEPINQQHFSRFLLFPSRICSSHFLERGAVPSRYYCRYRHILFAVAIFVERTRAIAVAVGVDTRHLRQLQCNCALLAQMRQHSQFFHNVMLFHFVTTLTSNHMIFTCPKIKRNSSQDRGD